MKGVPIRVEIGPKDIEKNQCVIVTRHNREKPLYPLTNLKQLFRKSFRRCVTVCTMLLLKTGNTEPIYAKLLMKSQTHLKKTETASLKQCGAEKKHVRIRLRKSQVLVHAVSLLRKSILQIPVFAVENPLSICFIGVRLINKIF